MRRILWLIPIAAAIGLDQFTKYLAVIYLKPIPTKPLIENVLHLTYLENRGAAFGMLEDHRWIFMVTSTIAIIAVLIFMFVGYKKFYNPYFYTGLSLIAGGGIGNMIDRFANGFVVDFIDFRLINFAVFNGADSCVCVGAAIVIIYVLISDFKDRKKQS